MLGIGKLRAGQDRCYKSRSRLSTLASRVKIRDGIGPNLGLFQELPILVRSVKSGTDYCPNLRMFQYNTAEYVLFLKTCASIFQF